MRRCPTRRCRTPGSPTLCCLTHNVTMRRVLAVVGVVALAACPGGRAKPPDKTHGPEIPTNFTPPPPLGAEPKSDPAGLGYAWLGTIHPRFHERWADSFLEDCRVYLPPSNPLNQETLEATVAF